MSEMLLKQDLNIGVFFDLFHFIENNYSVETMQMFDSACSMLFLSLMKKLSYIVFQSVLFRGT